MATALNSENYSALNDAINASALAGKIPIISIYTDASGNTLAVDSHGPVKDRAVLSISFSASYIDADGNATNPFIVVKFRDTASMIDVKFIDYFTSVDYVEDHWYVLGEVAIPKRQF